jgi:hypothetical protein
MPDEQGLVVEMLCPGLPEAADAFLSATDVDQEVRILQLTVAQ